MTATELCTLLFRTKFRFTDETSLQEKIGALLASKGIGHVREYRLSPKDRVDFMVGPIALEVKIASRSVEVERQLERYAQSPEVEELVLLTSRSAHRGGIPNTLNGKPVYVVYLLNSIF